MLDRLSVELLADRPDVVPNLEAWFLREWEPYYGAGGPGDARADILECCQRDQIPLAVVAFDAGVLCGTAALRPTSVITHKHLTPWLAALLVHPEHRGRGVGARLVEVVTGYAREFGFDELFVGTSMPDSSERRGGDPEFYLKRGWTFVEASPYFVGDVAILKRPL